MRGLDLLFGRWAVAEDAAFARAHLEQAEILAVLGVGVETRFALGHAERLPAVGAEDATDDLPGCLGLCHGKPAYEALSAERVRPRSGVELLELPGEQPAVKRDLAASLVRKPRVGEEPLVATEEAEHVTLVLNALSEGSNRLLRRRIC